MKWLLGDFLTGNITRTAPLPVNTETGDISLDIHAEDVAEINLSLNDLTQSERDNWKQTFAPLLNFIVLVDESKAWNASGAILFAGFINKVSPPVGKGTIRLQLTGINEYLKARIVADSWEKVTDPTLTIDFTGASQSDVMKAIISRAFSNAGIPAGKPTTPAMLAPITVASGAVKKSVKITSVQTYHDVLKQVSDENGGIEWRFTPKWTSSSMTNVTIDTTVGTSGTPHINDSVTIDMRLEENAYKISDFSTDLDSTELYSKLYIQSQPGDDEKKNGADFSTASVSNTTFPLLVERFFNPSVELTEAEMTAQLASRIDFAAKEKYETTLTIEEVSDYSIWINNIGKRIKVIGVNSAGSGGHDATVRIVGITFLPPKGTVKVELMQLSPIYPRLPKDRVKTIVTKDKGNSSPVTKPDTGGGTVPIPPIEIPDIGTGGGVDGVFTPDMNWGDAGHNPWDGNTPPLSPNDIGFKNFIEESNEILEFDGTLPVDPYSITKNSGNRLYGLDHLEQGWRSVYKAGVETSYGSGMNISTGLPNDGILPFYIKKMNMVDGKISEPVTVGTVTPGMILSLMGEWSGGIYGDNTSYYARGIAATIWNSGNFLYFLLMDTWQGTSSDSGNFGDVLYYELPSRTKTTKTLLRGRIDDSNGEIIKWEVAPYQLPKNSIFPLTPNISKYGENVVFMGGWQTCDEMVINGKIGNKKYNVWLNDYNMGDDNLNNIILMITPLGFEDISVANPYSHKAIFTQNGSYYAFKDMYSTLGSMGFLSPSIGFSYNGEMYETNWNNWAWNVGDGGLWILGKISLPVDGKMSETTKFNQATSTNVSVVNVNDYTNRSNVFLIKSSIVLLSFSYNGSVKKLSYSNILGLNELKTITETPYSNFDWPPKLLNGQAINGNSNGSAYHFGKQDGKNRLFYESKIFVYKDRVYTVRMSLNGTGERNVMDTRSMEGYEVTP